VGGEQGLGAFEYLTHVLGIADPAQPLHGVHDQDHLAIGLGFLIAYLEDSLQGEVARLLDQALHHPARLDLQLLPEGRILCE